MIYVTLNKRGVSISLPTVHKYMKELGLKSIADTKKYRYIKGKQHKTFKNIISRNFNATAKNKIWCTDFTYKRAISGKMLYICTILDLYDRSVISTMVSDKIDSEFAIRTLKYALQKEKVTKGLIFHSDQGSQFTSKNFIEFCEKHTIKQSMSKAGCPYDNAPMESFFGKFKSEELNHLGIYNLEHLNKINRDYCYRYYNYKRPHSFNNWLTPGEARGVA